MADTLDKAIKSVQGISGALDMQSKAIPDPYAEGQTANILFKSSQLVGAAGKKTQDVLDDYNTLAKGRLEDELYQDQDAFQKQIALLSARQGEYKDITGDEVYNKINELHEQHLSSQQEKIDKFSKSTLNNLSSDNLYAENLKLKGLQIQNVNQKIVQQAHKQEMQINISKNIHNAVTSLNKHTAPLSNKMDTKSINSDTNVAISDVLLSLNNTTDGNGNPITNPQERLEMFSNSLSAMISKSADNGNNPVSVGLSAIGKKAVFDKNGKMIGTEDDPEQKEKIEKMLTGQGFNKDQINQYYENVKMVMNHKLMQSDLESIQDGTYISKYTGLDLRTIGKDPNRPYETQEKVYQALGMTPEQQTRLIHNFEKKLGKGKGGGDKERSYEITTITMSASIWNDPNKVEEYADRLSKETGGTLSKQYFIDRINEERKSFKNPYNPNYDKSITQLTIEQTGNPNPTDQEIYDACQFYNVPVPPSFKVKENLDSLGTQDLITHINELSGDDVQSSNQFLFSITNDKNVFQSERLRTTYKAQINTYLQQKCFDKDGNPKINANSVFYAQLYLKHNGLIDEIDEKAIEGKQEQDLISSKEKELESGKEQPNTQMIKNYKSNASAFKNLKDSTNNKDLNIIEIANAHKKLDISNDDILKKEKQYLIFGKETRKLDKILPNNVIAGKDSIIILDFRQTISGKQGLINANSSLSREEQEKVAKDKVIIDVVQQEKYIKDFITANIDSVNSQKYSNISHKINVDDVVIRNGGKTDTLEAVYLNRKTGRYEPVMINGIPVTYTYQTKGDGLLDTTPTPIGFINNPIINVHNHGDGRIGGVRGAGFNNAIGGINVIDIPQDIVDAPSRIQKTKVKKPNTVENPLINKSK